MTDALGREVNLEILQVKMPRRQADDHPKKAFFDSAG